ncbi:ABC transporter permease [Beijerinckiaceae bacterium RH AL1]|jgi:branched-chain amino acid transport system permease protein|nr:branched-chain amino acid ABC transporter permease [Beijerinckiaceae bacterium]VVB44762.1 ABC transporter permease [Beijerinckiaceae bacterium RH CH11]VVB44841.1 ABC transporter permease [Beijerinckiaceae bacterium RH AL8]VVC54523.1 ABC transporter permease [Beijerinckiaceae bacterium RH AL1]
MRTYATPFGLVCLGLAAAAALFPLVAPNQYYLSVAALAFINALAAVGLNLIAGYTGQLNLAHAGFMAIGAYTVGILTVTYGVPFWPAFVAGGLVSAAAGALVGLVSLRLRGQVFAIFTLCVGVIIALVIEKAEGLTNGVNGIMDIPRATQIGPLSIDNDAGQYELVLAFLVAGLFIMQRIVTSLVGRGFVAIRNGEALAEALGINLMRTKLLAFVLSTFYAGIAGALYAGNLRFLGPGMASETVTFDLITYMIVGGIGTLLGPVVGALVVACLSQYLQALQDYRMVVLGPLLIVLIMFFPRGIVGWIETWLGRRRAARLDAAHAAAAHKVAENKLAEPPHA